VKVHLAYGTTGLDLDVPDAASVIRPRPVRGLPDEPAAIRSALLNPIDSPPLGELVGAGNSVVIVHRDITRPMPNDRVLPVLLAELEDAGIRRSDIPGST
jgi:nickel-dependent lactate racemase